MHVLVINLIFDLSAGDESGEGAATRVRHVPCEARPDDDGLSAVSVPVHPAHDARYARYSWRIACSGTIKLTQCDSGAGIQLVSSQIL